MSKLNFTNPKAPNYINVKNTDTPDMVVYKLVNAGEPFLALSYIAEGFKSASYKGPEKEKNITFGIGINLTQMSPEMRKEFLSISGYNNKQIAEINKGFASGNPPQVKCTLQQALEMAEHYREKYAEPAAEKRFGQKFLDKQPEMRKALIEYQYFHYGEAGANKMKTLQSHFENERYENFGRSVTSNRRLEINGKDVFVPMNRGGAIMAIAMADKGEGEFFALGVGKHLDKLENFAKEYNNKTETTIKMIKQGKKAKFETASENIDQHLKKVDEDLLNYFNAPGKNNYEKVIKTKFEQEVKNKGIEPQLTVGVKNAPTNDDPNPIPVMFANHQDKKESYIEKILKEDGVEFDLATYYELAKQENNENIFHIEPLAISKQI